MSDSGEQARQPVLICGSRGRARHVPVRTAVSGQSGLLTDKSRRAASWETADQTDAATTFASRGSGFESP